MTPKSAKYEIRQLTSEDAASFRSLRLEALTSCPDAFGAAFEDESTKPMSAFSDRLRTSSVFGAFRGSALVGMAGLFIQHGPKTSHKGTLWGMYVKPEARSSGVGRKLVEAAIGHARQRIELFQLTVVADNTRALRLYRSLGFSEYGLERKALRFNGRYWDEVLMAKDLGTG